MASDRVRPPLDPVAARLAGKKAIRSYARKLADPEDIKDLNITPMMDMMTIILVFLLKSFTSSATLVNLDQNLALPPSQTMLAPKQAVALTITKRIVLIDGEAICPITGGRVDPQLKRDGDNGYYITPIVDMLSKIATREKKIAELTGQKFDGELTIIADKTTPYRLLTEVLYSCGQAEYANYRLLVLKARE
jgi:biopolymer transport protein ExbD